MGRTPAVDWYDFRGLAFLLGNRVLARFWGRECCGFFGGVASFGVPVFFSLFSLSFSLSSSFFSGGRPGCLFSSCALFGDRTPDYRYLFRPGIAHMRSCLFFLLFLPGSVASPSLPPSFCPLSFSFSLSLSLLQARIAP